MYNLLHVTFLVPRILEDMSSKFFLKVGNSLQIDKALHHMRQQSSNNKIQLKKTNKQTNKNEKKTDIRKKSEI